MIDPALPFLTLQELPLSGKRILLRVDFNVPLNAAGEIIDDSRIRASLPSIEYILRQPKTSLVIMSHLGRPEGRQEPRDSLAPCARQLQKLLGRSVKMAPSCIGEEVERLAMNLREGELLLLENLRFFPAEEKPSLDPSFAKALARLGDLYVDDAFGAAHRAHASIVDVALLFPGKAAAGLLMQSEVAALSMLLGHPKRPFYALLGGAKISTKIGILRALLDKVDGLFLGGGMVFTFLKAQGIEVGRSLISLDHVDDVRALMQTAQTKGIPLFFPSDFVIAKTFEEKAEHRIVSQEEGIANDWLGMDIGPKTVAAWSCAFNQAATIFWNGPLGVYEMEPFAQGTSAIAQSLSHSSATVVVGGGDSVAAIQRLGLAQSFAHLSTGGGASLEFLEAGHLPGIDVLYKIFTHTRSGQKL